MAHLMPYQLPFGESQKAPQRDIYEENADSEHSPIKLSNGIEISANDDREYRHLELGNGLSVMLISDEKADRTGAAMDVNVGHFSDPEEIPGLAHFCEHMLFLGSEKYPSENEYSEYLNQNGGESNAFTDMEHTCFFFEVQPNALEGALDRFAQFFVSPLFTEDCTERELNAVDSEHSKNYQSDFWRLFQLDKSTSDERHAYSKFATGDSRTLRDEPQKTAIDVRRSLLHFHAKHYVAKNLKLAVAGKQSLDELQQWVEKFFADVPKAPEENIQQISETPEEGKRVPPLPDHPNISQDVYLPYQEGVHTGICQRVVPNKDLRTLQLGWAVPSVVLHYQTKPGHYTSHLLGHEGPGSVLSLLKRRGLATELMAGIFHSEETFAIFGVKVELTTEGLENTTTVIDIIFSYLNILRKEGPQKWIWEELQKTDENSFRFRPKRDPSDTLIPLVRNLQYHSPKHVVACDNLMWLYDPTPINALLERLTPGKAKVQIISKEFDGKTDLHEKWYGTAYSQTRVEGSLLSQWETPSFASKEHLHLPTPNEFIASDFTLRFPKVPQPTAQHEYERIVRNVSNEKIRGVLEGLKHARTLQPTVVKDTSHAFALWQGDARFGEPKGAIKAKFNFPATYKSAKNTVMTEIFCDLWKESLNEFAYAASIADLQYDVSVTSEGITLSVFGFNDKLQTLLKRVLEEVMPEVDSSGVKEFKKQFFDDDQFERIRDVCERNYLNFYKNLPARLSIYEQSYCTTVPRWHVADKLQATKTVTANDIRNFVEELFEDGFVTTLIHGNFSSEEAANIANQLDHPFRHSNLSRAQLTRLRSLSIPGGSKLCVQLPAFNPLEENCAVTVCYQLGPDTIYNQVMGSILSQLMEEPAFHTLRTQKTLGYIVQVMKMSQNGAIDLHILIQSNKVGSRDLQEHVLDFVEIFEDHLKQMEEETFNSHIAALISDELELDKNLAEEIRRTWQQVNSSRYRFNQPIEMTNLLSRITKDDVLEFYYNQLHPSGKSIRRLSILIRSGTQEEQTTDTTGELNVFNAISEHFVKAPKNRIIEAMDEVLLRSREDVDLLRMSYPLLPDLAEFYEKEFKSQASNLVEE
eukprot:gb/GECG01003407.1/.p1 GENE.gb/GECG01003407.1/~~gb/GECG01003407.1/.p1  ORF type:complete len:1092 (+),score=141.62 gb/GECG01003407.1/:1-3276(+)